MSINLILKTPAQPSDTGLQFLPAKVDATIEEGTNAGIFFDSYTRQETGSDTLCNTLRGYPVRGTRFDIPASHIGMVFEEDKQPLAENATRTFQQTGQFERFALWNYDQTPSRNDGLKMAVEGFCLTEELHKRVDPIELELFLLADSNGEKPTNGSSISTEV